MQVLDREPIVRRLASFLGGDRVWSLIGGLSVRASGFIASFVLARVAGAHAVGQYSAVVNTAGTACAPVLSVIPNAATFHAARGLHSEVGAAGLLGSASARTLATLTRVYARIALAFAVVSCAAFAGLYRAIDVTDGAPLLALLAGCASVLGQIAAGALQGVWFGSGRFRFPSLAAAGVSSLATLAVLPIASLFGAAGALGVLAITALAYPALLVVFGRGPQVCADDVASARRAARDIIMRSTAIMGSTILAGLATWLSSVLLVHAEYGTAGVGLVAIGTQWTTLLVLAVTSWGGVTMKALSAPQSRDALRKTVGALLVRHLIVTGIGSVIVSGAAGLIAHAYSADDTPLVTLLRVNAVVALVMSGNNVFERLLFCSGAQSAWVRAVVVGNLVQVTIVVVALSRGLEVAALAMLGGSLVTFGYGVVTSRRLLSER